MVKVGDKAPLFEGIADNGEKISLSDYIGKHNVVLYFYPKDDTPGCTREACAFRDNWNLLKDYDVVVIGVSSDDVDSHKKFKEKYKLPFILVSDPDKKIRELYGAKGFILPARVTFVIDKKGMIRHIYNSQTNPANHVNEALKALKQIKAEEIS
ncbi:peroxiredoxin [Saccharolobus shibatae]|uniref:thioredoxin-dependent peroxiredoxin n=2 Tax=Saccharolobus shibatae TaxID=2286 RepID=A0A8F5GZV1_9CREN|nr:peroxiredoxin [Saccharolobus shibatae]QXJ29357.1 Peroxiredoxin, Bcp-type [Saccharolobus shibatae B12]QXJ32582.1 Peroxiredoxin, Bcp-type [Saccharolobus shibatae]QXJ35743.1 Peroxiredoxin, Bcp-type [Saccharolobus shibatae]